MNDPPTNRELYDLFLSLDRNTREVLGKMLTAVEAHSTRIQNVENLLLNLHLQINNLLKEINMLSAITRTIKR
jgi:hypothetical protein